MDFGLHLPLMDFGGNPLTLDHLITYAETGQELGFSALAANDHLVYSKPWLDGPTALADFASARLLNLNKLNSLNREIWSRKARHAIFGPTNFLEVTGFMADHDRMHIQQAWQTIKSL